MAALGPAAQLMSARHCTHPWERPCQVEIPSSLPTPEDPPGCSSSAGQRRPGNPSARAVGSARSRAWGGTSAPACLDMAGQRGGLPLPLLLLSLAGLVPHLALGTTATDVTVTMSTAHPTSSTPMETSALLPTSTSTTAATVLPSSPETGASTPETGASTPERSSTSPGPSSTPTMPPPTTPAPTAASAEPSTTPSDTTATPDTSTGVHGSTPAPSQPEGTTATPGISTMTTGLVPGTPTAPETSSAATGMEPSSPAANSTQTPEVTLSTPADLSTTPPVCSTATSNTSASHLFLSLRLTVPLDLRNTTVRELVLSKLRSDLQTVFPFAGLAVEWRGHKRT